MKSPRRCLCAAALAAVCLPTSTPAAAPDARQLLQDLRRHYRALTTYRDHGSIETITFEDGGERSWRHGFTTTGRGGAQVRLDLRQGAEPGEPETVLWSEGGGWVFRWDAADRRWGAVESWVHGAETLLPPGAAAALVVPALLAGEEPALLAGVEACSEASQPCGAGECRVLRLEPPAESDGERLRGRLWIDPHTPRLRRVEVEVLPPQPGAAVWVRLDLEVDEARQGTGVAGEQPEPLFLLPPDAVFEEGRGRRHAESDREEAPFLFDHEVVELPAGAPVEASFADFITVDRATVTVRAFDPRGEPLKDLQAEDFLLEVGGSEIPIESADWIDFDEPWASALSAQELALLGGEVPPPGPLVVLFVHSARESFRTLGHLRFRNHLRSLLAALPESARLAVVAYDVRLKLWQDFTSDRDRIYDAVGKAVYFTAEPEAPGAGDGELRLLDVWDFEAARRTGFAEDALAVLGDSLGELPGDKVVVYLGWGLGEAVVGGFQRAAGALVRGDIPLYALDVTPSLVPGGGHTLAVGLAKMAKVTGGTYGRTADWPERASRRVAHNLSGYYLLLIDSQALPQEGGRVTVRLRDRSRGEVVHPLFAFDRGPDGR